MKQNLWFLRMVLSAVLLPLLFEVIFSRSLLANATGSYHLLQDLRLNSAPTLTVNEGVKQPDSLEKLRGLVQNSEVDIPLCYMTTQSGRTINLTNLCGEQLPPQRSPECTSKAVSANLAIAQVNYDGSFLTGNISNQSCKTVKNLKVNYEVLDASGNQIDNGFIVAQPEVLPPGGTASFRGAVTEGAKVLATHVDWSD